MWVPFMQRVYHLTTMFCFYCWIFPSYYHSFALINVLHPDDPISVFYAVRRIIHTPFLQLLLLLYTARGSHRYFSFAQIVPNAGIMFLSFEYSKRFFLFYNGYTKSPFSNVPKSNVDQSMSPNEVSHHYSKRKGYKR